MQKNVEIIVLLNPLVFKLLNENELCLNGFNIDNLEIEVKSIESKYKTNNNITNIEFERDSIINHEVVYNDTIFLHSFFSESGLLKSDFGLSDFSDIEMLNSNYSVKLVSYLINNLDSISLNKLIDFEFCRN
jgi:hypothetical protein